MGSNNAFGAGWASEKSSVFGRRWRLLLAGARGASEQERGTRFAAISQATRRCSPSSAAARVARGRVIGTVAPGPLAAQCAARLEHHHRLLDRVDGAALAPAGLADLGVPGTTGDANHALPRAAARDPGVKAGRLGHDPGVGLQTARHQHRPARPRGPPSVLVATTRSPSSSTPSEASVSTANTMAAIPPFMSHAPRP
jgi:hypothetical protein